MADLSDQELVWIASNAADRYADETPKSEVSRAVAELQRRRAEQAAGREHAATTATTRVGQAPKCHQDPSDSGPRCAVHDEAPDWHSEVAGYRGPAGWYCHSGGHVFDQQISDAALVAYNASRDAELAKRKAEESAACDAAQVKWREHVERVVREELPASTSQVISNVLGGDIARRVADRLSGPVPERRGRTRDQLVALLGENGADNYLSWGQPTSAPVLKPSLAERRACLGFSEPTPNERADNLDDNLAHQASHASAPVLSADVARGLQLLRRHLDEGGHDWRNGTDMADVSAARAWIDRFIAGAKP